MGGPVASEHSDEILLTADTDFGDLVWRKAQAFHGGVLMRTHPLSRHVDQIVSVMTEHRDELAGAFVVISSTQIRIRRRASSGS